MLKGANKFRVFWKSRLLPLGFLYLCGEKRFELCVCHAVSVGAVLGEGRQIRCQAVIQCLCLRVPFLHQAGQITRTYEDTEV